MSSGTIIRLLIASLIVGLVLAWQDMTPIDVYRRIADALAWAWNNSVDLFGDYGAAILAGASIVVPIWLVLTLLSRRRKR
ncbi:MAG: DUF6460 domain-containing protein [Rhodothalassiaceae bacterium]